MGWVKAKTMACALILSMVLELMAANLAWAETNPSPTSGLKVDCQGAILVDAQTGQILFGHNPHQRWQPASVTKLMTLGMALEAIQQGKAHWTDRVLTSEQAADMGGAQVYLESGEQRTLEEMLIAVMVGSANDASVAVAEHLAGSEEAFVEQMNQKAQQLGLKNTHFTNCHGLPDKNHYSSAYDLAQIARWVLQFPDTLRLSSLKYYRFREKPLLELWNLNKLLWWYPGADGLKTGSHSEAGLCLASTAKRDALRLIAVVLGATKQRGQFSESMKMFNYGFARYKRKDFYASGQKVADIPVEKGMMDLVGVVPTQPVGITVEKGKEKDISLKVMLPRTINAPVSQGQKIGEAVVSQGNHEVLKVDLVACEPVRQASLWRQIQKILAKLVA